VLNQNKPFMLITKLPSTKPINQHKNQNQSKSIFCGLVKRDKGIKLKSYFACSLWDPFPFRLKKLEKLPAD
jgi:hypothetical protein